MIKRLLASALVGFAFGMLAEIAHSAGYREGVEDGISAAKREEARKQLAAEQEAEVEAEIKKWLRGERVETPLL